MAIVKTNSVHYEGIADALRGLHDGEETYTPAEMAEYLATQGTELKPENIVYGATVFGVEGTMLPDPPPPPGLETADIMFLKDDMDNLTWGFMSKDPIPGMYNYAGAILPEMPALPSDFTGTTGVILAEYDDYGQIIHADLYRCRAIDIGIWQNLMTSSSWLHSEYDISTGAWSEYELRSYSPSTDLIDPYTTMVNIGDRDVVWCNKDIHAQNVYQDPLGLWRKADPDAFPASFALTAYNYDTTEFRAIGWVRVAYHTTGPDAGKFTYHDYLTSPSTGWNYIKNVRRCTRDALEFHNKYVWYKGQGPERYNCNGHLLCYDTRRDSYGNYHLIRDDNGYCLVRSETTLRRRADGLLSTNTGGESFDIEYFYPQYNSGIAKPIMPEGAFAKKTVTTTSGDVLWCNRNILNFSGGIAFSGSPALAVYNPDLVDTSAYLYGFADDNGNIAIDDGNGGYIRYTGIVADRPPLTEKGASEFMCISSGYEVESLHAIQAVNFAESQYGDWSVCVEAGDFTLSNFTLSDWAQPLGSRWMMRSDHTEAKPYIAFDSVKWANFDVLDRDGSVYLPKGEYFPIVSAEPTRYEGDIPVYLKKEVNYEL